MHGQRFCLRLLLRGSCGILAEHRENNAPSNISIWTQYTNEVQGFVDTRHICIYTYLYKLTVSFDRSRQNNWVRLKRVQASPNYWSSLNRVICVISSPPAGYQQTILPFPLTVRVGLNRHSGRLLVVIVVGCLSIRKASVEHSANAEQPYRRDDACGPKLEKAWPKYGPRRGRWAFRVPNQRAEMSVPSAAWLLREERSYATKHPGWRLGKWCYSSN